MEQSLLGNAADNIWNISDNEFGFEFMMNALRLTDGVPVNLFQMRTGLHINTLEGSITQAQNKKLVEVKNDYIQPTLLGQRFLNELLTLFMTN